MRGPSLSASAVGLLVLVTGAAAAHAGVVVGEGVPFTADELADAIEARSGEASGDVEVERVADAELRLITPRGTWQVAVGEAQGAVAARLVALHVVDRDDLGAIALPPPRQRVAVAPSQAPFAEDLEEPSADEEAAGPRTGPWFGVRTGIMRGTDGTDLAAFAGTLELGGERERWIAAVEAGVHLSGASADAGDVRWVTPHARLHLGRRAGSFELLGNVLLGQMFFTNVGDKPSATMVSLGGSARMVLPVGAGPWRVVAGIGADAYQNRIVIRRVGVEEASTPRLALSGTVGLTMVLGR